MRSHVERSVQSDTKPTLPASLMQPAGHALSSEASSQAAVANDVSSPSATTSLQTVHATEGTNVGATIIPEPLFTRLSLSHNPDEGEDDALLLRPVAQATGSAKEQSAVASIEADQWVASLFAGSAGVEALRPPPLSLSNLGSTVTAPASPAASVPGTGELTAPSTDRLDDHRDGSADVLRDKAAERAESGGTLAGSPATVAASSPLPPRPLVASTRPASSPNAAIRGAKEEIDMSNIAVALATAKPFGRKAAELARIASASVLNSTSDAAFSPRSPVSVFPSPISVTANAVSRQTSVFPFGYADSNNSSTNYATDAASRVDAGRTMGLLVRAPMLCRPSLVLSATGAEFSCMCCGESDERGAAPSTRRVFALHYPDARRLTLLAWSSLDESAGVLARELHAALTEHRRISAGTARGWLPPRIVVPVPPSLGSGGGAVAPSMSPDVTTHSAAATPPSSSINAVAARAVAALAGSVWQLQRGGRQPSEVGAASGSPDLPRRATASAMVCVGCASSTGSGIEAAELRCDGTCHGEGGDADVSGLWTVNLRPAAVASHGPR